MNDDDDLLNHEVEISAMDEDVPGYHHIQIYCPQDLVPIDRIQSAVLLAQCIVVYSF